MLRKSTVRSPYFEMTKPKKTIKNPKNPTKKTIPKKFKPAFNNVPTVVDLEKAEIKYFPLSAEDRKEFISSKTNRTITEFEYKVYEICKQIPEGHFSTYKAMSDYLKSGPRAVGNALRKNPFAPFPIPCHRVLTSNMFIGGYDGDMKSKIFWKKALLEKEGLKFDEKGYVQEGMEDRLIKDFSL
ncbi:hypothetical protein BB558_003231 [Smittium angustum]|uniref:Methylated-DNA--protein-cysteine methyltransferase n=1 Tax=Smittium angustum TaxID=133377 RepID=A0A2U1J6L7_SMIAN|nr:hypothetical protein BB558_003231 [Smittium angustum]